MANELEITRTKDSIIIRCLDENIFNDKVNHYLKNGYQLAEKVVTNKFGLNKAILKKLIIFSNSAKERNYNNNLFLQ